MRAVTRGVESPVGHVVHCDCSSGAPASIWARAMPGQRVVVVDVSLLDRTGMYTDHFPTEFRWHSGDTLERFEPSNMVAPLM